MTRRDELLALAERCEGAEANMTGALIEDAWELVAPTFPRDGLADRASDFGLKMDARAYLDAAKSLLPKSEGVGWGLSDGAGGAIAEVWAFNFDPDDFRELYHVYGGCCATPEQALCAAALRALAQQVQQ